MNKMFDKVVDRLIEKFGDKFTKEDITDIFENIAQLTASTGVVIVSLGIFYKLITSCIPQKVVHVIKFQDK